MLNISTSAISDPNIQMPFTGPMLAALQQNVLSQDLVASCPFWLSPTTFLSTTILYGCIDVVTGTALNPIHTISAGVIANLQGVWNVNASVVTLNTGITSQATVITSLQTTDPYGPVTFSDGVARVVYQNQTINLVAGTTGTGFITTGGDFDTWIPIMGTPQIITLDTGDGWSISSYAPTLRKDCFGNVSMFGQLKAPGVQNSPFTLPVGYRPKTNRIWNLWSSDNSQSVNIVLESNGNVLLERQDSSSLVTGTIVELNVNYNVLD